MTPHEQTRESVASLQNALLTAHPQMPVILRTVLQKLKNDPDVVTLMTEEEIGVIVSAAKKHTGVEIAAIAQKSKTKSLKTMTADDI